MLDIDRTQNDRLPLKVKNLNRSASSFNRTNLLAVGIDRRCRQGMIDGLIFRRLSNDTHNTAQAVRFWEDRTETRRPNYLQILR